MRGITLNIVDHLLDLSKIWTATLDKGNDFGKVELWFGVISLKELHSVEESGRETKVESAN